ncbi:MAG: hypothetical protein QNL04_14445 [SAR324 cluster bacterium]|nr:hypothetical protein [SAR324 cluster bacterium]
MTTGEKAKGNGCALIFVLILAGIILFLFLLMLWENYIPENPPDQYKTPVVFRGVTDTEVACNKNLRCTPHKMIMSFVDATAISMSRGYEGKIFTLKVIEIEQKEEALRQLQLAIDGGYLYVDDQNYLVTE